MKIKVPCIVCGNLSENTRCEPCSKANTNMRLRSHSKKTSSTQRGYNSAWKRLSERARKQQPFCSDCGATNDLQADHTPQAWKRYEKGLPLRISDIDVVCGPCNRKRGAARGEHVRSDFKASNSLERVEGQR